MMPATPKQTDYLKSLLTDAGYLNAASGSFRGNAKHLPHGPTQRERGNADSWFQRLSPKQASEIIDALKQGK